MGELFRPLGLEGLCLQGFVEFRPCVGILLKNRRVAAKGLALRGLGVRGLLGMSTGLIGGLATVVYRSFCVFGEGGGRMPGNKAAVTDVWGLGLRAQG